MSILDSIFNPGKDAAKASVKGAKIAADAQMAGLNYLKETEKLPQQYREGALTKLAGVYGIGDDPEAAKQFVFGLKENPLYQAILGTRGAGESAILRNASATGGLRSGNTNAQLTDYGQQLENKALLDTYNTEIAGLGGLGQLPSMAPQIAQSMAGVGSTLAQGQIAAAQAKEQGTQNTVQNLLGLGGLFFSDKRLKDSVVKIGENNGLNIYSWTWNEEAETIGLSGSGVGLMADEVEAVRPDLVSYVNGYKVVNYSGVYDA